MTRDQTRLPVMKLKNILLTALLLAAAGSLQAADGFFVAVGGENGKRPDGHGIEAQFGTVYLSKDGKTWENVFRGGPVKDNFSHAHNNLLRDLTYGKDTFVAAGNPGVMTSRDGRNWKLTDRRNSFSVAYGNGIFIAPSAAAILRSEDGFTWEQFKPKNVKDVWGKGGAGHIRKAVFGNGVFVCIGGNRLSVTKDGKTSRRTSTCGRARSTTSTAKESSAPAAADCPRRGPLRRNPFSTTWKTEAKGTQE